MTHFIKHLSFGKDYPGIVNPLDGTNVAAPQGKCVLFLIFMPKLKMCCKEQCCPELKSPSLSSLWSFCCQPSIKNKVTAKGQSHVAEFNLLYWTQIKRKAVFKVSSNRQQLNLRLSPRFTEKICFLKSVFIVTRVLECGYDNK